LTAGMVWTRSWSETHEHGKDVREKFRWLQEILEKNGSKMWKMTLGTWGSRGGD